MAKYLFRIHPAKPRDTRARRGESGGEARMCVLVLHAPHFFISESYLHTEMNQEARTPDSCFGYARDGLVDLHDM
jgi:hypothetical protein